MSSTAEPRMVLVLTTLDADHDGAAFARTLIDEKLAACVSVLPPMTSVYRWKGAIDEAREQQLLIKTTEARVEALAARFRTLHPYELPEFVVVRPEQASALYRHWVDESVGEPAEARPTTTRPAKAGPYEVRPKADTTHR